MAFIISIKKREFLIRESVNNNSYKSLFFLLLLIIYLFALVRISKANANNEESKILSAQSLKLNGYTQAEYTHWTEGREGFRLRRARVGLKGDVLNNVNYKLQIDAVKMPILLDAQIKISFVPCAKLTFGQFKVPFSLENLTSSSSLDTINRSQTVEKLCPGRDIGAQGRDIGVTFGGQFSRIEYIIGVFNGSGINKADCNDQKDIVGRVVFNLSSAFIFGLSYYNGKYSPYPEAPVVKRNRTGMDVSLVQGRLSVKGEYIFARDDKTNRYGWYVQGGYFFASKKIQTIIKYDSFDTKNTRRGRIDVITFGINYFFTEKTKFQINYEYQKGKSGAISNNAILAQLQAGF